MIMQVARQLADSLRTALDTAQGKVEMGGEVSMAQGSMMGALAHSHF